MDKLEDDTAEEDVEEAAVHIKMGLTCYLSPVTFKMQSGPYYQTRQEKGRHRTQYALSL